MSGQAERSSLRAQYRSVDRISAQRAADGKGPFQWKTIPQGAAISVWAGVVAAADEIGGCYCENCHVGNIVPDDAVLTVVSEGVRAYAVDPTKGRSPLPRQRLRSDAVLGQVKYWNGDAGFFTGPGS